MADIGIIFDSDGVIVDSEHQSLEAFKRAIAEQGIELTDEDLWKCCGLTDRAIIENLEEKYEQSIDLKKFTKRKFELYFQLADSSLQVFPGVIRLLDELEKADVPYALASSGPHPKIEFNLDKVGLSERFKYIVSGEEVVKSKPAPYIFLEAADKMQCSPFDCIVIEDSPSGLLGARRAGMIAIGLRSTFKDDAVLKEAHYIYDSIQDINLELLCEIFSEIREVYYG